MASKVESDQDRGEKHNLAAPPSIALPKGGGEIRGMGEKFAANPVTGTGSMTIPIAVSPGRSGFGPQLALSYDSGNLQRVKISNAPVPKLNKKWEVKLKAEEGIEDAWLLVKWG